MTTFLRLFTHGRTRLTRLTRRLTSALAATLVAWLGTMSAGSQEALVTDLVFPGVEIEDVLIKYSELSGLNVIRTPGVAGTIHIVQNEQEGITVEQALDLIRTSLFYHGVALLPHRPGIEVAVSWAGGTPYNFPSPDPSAQRILYTDPADLPEDGSFVNYSMQLKYIGADEAAAAFALLMPIQTGRYTPIPNAGRVIISETVPIVRTLIAYKEQLDVPEQVRENRFVQLRLSDAEEVSTAIGALITAQEQIRTQNAGGRTNTRGAAQNLANVPAPLQGVPGTGTAAPNSLQPTISTGSGVIVQADLRTNRLLLNGRKQDVDYIEGLVLEFDKPTEVETSLTRQLRYFSAIEFLDVAATGLERFTSRGAGGGGSPLGGGAGRQRQNNRNTVGGTGTGVNAGGFGGQTGAGGRTNRGGGRGGAGGRAGGAGARLQAQELFPESITVDNKTFMIADPRSNSIIASGPPEHLGFITELIEKLDVRPLQVYISAVLAQVTLGSDIQVGIDILRTVDDFELGGETINAGGFFRNISGGTGIIDPNTLDSIDSLSGLGGQALNLYGDGAGFAGYLRLLETRSDFKVLARPFIFTGNNQVATISIGERVPVPTSQQSQVLSGGGQSLNTNIDFEDVLLELAVAPRINSENEVTLTVSQINDNITGSSVINNDEIPIISTQTLDTTVTVPNGGVLVIGGLISKSERKTNGGLPFITKLPILRTLLGNGTKDFQRTELLVFIQPRIIDSSASLVAAHTDQVRRSVVSDEVEEFTLPPYDTDELVLPKEEGDVPWKMAGDPSIQPGPRISRSSTATKNKKTGWKGWFKGLFGGK
jgi:general secretion pathway protein D